MIALLIVAGGLLVRRVLRSVAEPRLREVFVGFTLLLVLGTAALMEWVGLSMALGAFLAGVMLADSEYRHELELDIEPFKGLLRSEEHTCELQSQSNLVCRLLLEKKKKNIPHIRIP